MQRFFVKYMSFPLMITVGIGTTLEDYAKVFVNPAYLLVIIVTVLGAMLGTFLVGSLFHYYPVEGMLTAGLCMANGGGGRGCAVPGGGQPDGNDVLRPDLFPDRRCHHADRGQLFLRQFSLS
jgi:Na+/citrate or Na+/malate symporter